MTEYDYYKTKIAEYNAERNSSCWMDPVVEYVLEQKNIDNAITKAVMSRARNGKKHPHQWHLSDDVLDDYAQILLEVKETINELKSFDELLYVLQSNKIRGVGELLFYDASVRIGHFLKLFPEKIYIHAGTRIGLEGFLKRKIHGTNIGKQLLPEPFRSCELTPGQLEDFFCIYKEIFKDGNERNGFPSKKWCR